MEREKEEKANRQSLLKMKKVEEINGIRREINCISSFLTRFGMRGNGKKMKDTENGKGKKRNEIESFFLFRNL